MDRDIVNALHFLYQEGETKEHDLLSRLWCASDSVPDIDGLAERERGLYRLSPYLIRFLKAVEGQLANMPRPDFVFSFPFSQKPRKHGERRFAFVAMPYGPDWFKSVRDVIEASASATGFFAEVSKDLGTPGSITDQIWQGLRRAEVVVADISGHNPNVFYELGLAHALGKEVILIMQGSEQAPFDISTARQVRYDAQNLPALGAQLRNAFASVSARYKYEGKQPYF